MFTSWTKPGSPKIDKAGYPILSDLLLLPVSTAVLLLLVNYNMSHYKRKTTRQSWDQESMQNAIVEVLEHRMGYKRASQSFNVPQSTLEDRVKKVRNGNSVEEASKKGRNYL